MKVGLCNAPGDFKLAERPEPAEIPDGWVLLDIHAVGVCGTDYHIYEGKHPFLQYPRVIGHEISGTVVRAAGEFKVGELVVVNPYLACGNCRACRRGKPNCCYNIEVLGVHRDGGLCERLAVPASNLYPADGLSSTAAAMVEFLAIGAHAVERTEVCAGDRCLVVGVGPIGIGAALFAAQRGAEVHLLDRSEARLVRARHDFKFENTHQTHDDALLATGGEGFDNVLDCTGNATSMEAVVGLAAHGATCCLVGVVKDRVGFAHPEFHKRELRLIGSRNALAEDFELVMRSFRTGVIKAEELCSRTYSLDEIGAEFGALCANRDGVLKAIVRLRD